MHRVALPLEVAWAQAPKHGLVRALAHGDLQYTRAGARDRSGSGGQLVWLDRTGTVIEPIGPKLFDATGPALSPDGRWIAVSSQGLSDEEPESGADIWLVDVERDTAIRLAAEPDTQMSPAWSADGQRIAYLTGAGRFDLDGLVLQARSADGAGDPDVLVDKAGDYSLTPDWSVGAFVTGTTWLEDTQIMIQRVGDESTRVVFQDGPEREYGPQIRPGGGLIGYASVEEIQPPGRAAQLLLRRFPEGAGRWQVTMSLRGQYRWSRSGDRLYYITGESREERILMEMTVTLNADDVELGDAVPLFKIDGWNFSGFDVAPDDERFLAFQRETIEVAEERKPDTSFVIVENWFEEFRETTR